MALAAHPLGVYTPVNAVTFEWERRRVDAGSYDNSARTSSSSSSGNINGSRACRSNGFSSSATSGSVFVSFPYQIPTSVAYVNCAARVHSRAGVVAALEKDEGKLQKKKKPVVDDSLPELDEFNDELQGYLNLELQSGLDMDSYKHYEIMFIIHEKNVDEVQAVIDKVSAFVQDNKGFIYRINNWGLRRLAYKIKKAEKGNYVLMNIEVGAGVINDLNALLEKDERVIRHMLMSQDEAVSEDMEPPEEWRPSSAFAEKGGEAQEEDEEEYYDDDEEVEEEEEGAQRSGELILERQQ
ncbi:hypothetical protein R1sor_019660 [Riccia sorocarpa]|uniref:30S ribosomal protein S6 n=1 Tax=Riccia sorocarpa TaxID=122646 RepID=A0ABD3ID52_9MARC